MKIKINKNYIFFLLFSLVILLFYERNKLIYYDNLMLSYIKSFLVNNQRLAPIFFILIYICAGIFLLPIFPLTILGGVLFGGFYGTIYVVLSCSIVVGLSYVLSRFLIDTKIFKKITKNEFYIKISERVNSEKFQIICVTRLVPTFPFGVQNYIYGALKVNFLSYWLVSTLLIGIITIPYTTGAGIALDHSIPLGKKLLYIFGLIAIIYTFNTLVKYIKKRYEEE